MVCYIFSFVISGINFSGWKTENVVGEFPTENGRIIVVKPKDHSSHWAKVSKSNRITSAKF